VRSRKVLGNRPRMATSYHQLGMIAQYRGWWDDAEDWYHKSLTINEDLGDQLPGPSGSTHGRFRPGAPAHRRRPGRAGDGLTARPDQWQYPTTPSTGRPVDPDYAEWAGNAFLVRFLTAQTKTPRTSRLRNTGSPSLSLRSLSANSVVAGWLELTIAWS
jgi:hypothetical protein